MKTALLFASLGGILALSVWGSVVIWTSVENVELSGHGIFAMILGLFFSLALGAGLMALVFYSSRAGFDDPES